MKMKQASSAKQAPNSSLPAVFKKYSQAKFHEVAKMPGPTAV